MDVFNAFWLQLYHGFENLDLLSLCFAITFDHYWQYLPGLYVVKQRQSQVVGEVLPAYLPYSRYSVTWPQRYLLRRINVETDHQPIRLPVETDIGQLNDVSVGIREKYEEHQRGQGFLNDRYEGSPSELDRERRAGARRSTTHCQPLTPHGRNNP